MHKAYCLSLLFLLVCFCCKKNTPPSSPVVTNYITYTIPQGEHYALGYDSTHFIFLRATHLHFKAIFDNSAIYKTASANDQSDVNKLYGFSDNEGSHHVYSARVGWSWHKDSLRLFGYTYNDSIRTIKQIAIVQIGKEIDCDIAVDTVNKQYLFNINGRMTPMPRKAGTSLILGYKLYPYFGGEEVAPHTVTIKVGEVP